MSSSDYENISGCRASAEFDTEGAGYPAISLTKVFRDSQGQTKAIASVVEFHKSAASETSHEHFDCLVVPTVASYGKRICKEIASYPIPPMPVKATSCGTLWSSIEIDPMTSFIISSRPIRWLVLRRPDPSNHLDCLLSG